MHGSAEISVTFDLPIFQQTVLTFDLPMLTFDLPSYFLQKRALRQIKGQYICAKKMVDQRSTLQQSVDL